MDWKGRVTGSMAHFSGYLCSSFYFSVFVFPSLTRRHLGHLKKKCWMKYWWWWWWWEWCWWEWLGLHYIQPKTRISIEGSGTVQFCHNTVKENTVTELDATSRELSQKQDHQCRNKSRVLTKFKQEKQSTHDWSVCLCLCFGLSSLLDKIKKLYKWHAIPLDNKKHLCGNVTKIIPRYLNIYIYTLYHTYQVI